METKRQLDVLDRHLAGRETICASGYSIADIAIWPWYGRLALGEVYDAAEFLDTASYQHVLRWARLVQEREAVQTGLAAAR
jgi:GST-like protein